MKLIIGLAKSIFLSLIFFHQIYGSCPGIVQDPPCAEFWRADAVFVGTATKIETEPQRFGGVTPPSVVQFAVEEIFKGIEGKQFVLEQASCGHQFTEGEKYLIYAHRNSNTEKLFVRSRSTRTARLSEAGEDLAYLRSLARGDEQARIVGIFGQNTADIKYRGFEEKRFFFGEPIAGLKIFAEGKDGIVYEAFTGGKGEYQFFGLPNGEYQIRPEVPSYFDFRAVKISTAEKGCAVANLRAWRKGAISGRVLDENGSPLNGVPVSLVPANVTPEEIFEENETSGVWNFALTDSMGSYHFKTLPAGNYFVIINRAKFERSRGSESAQKIPRLFYPNAISPKTATVISIKEGETARDKNFRVWKTND